MLVGLLGVGYLDYSNYLQAQEHSRLALEAKVDNYTDIIQRAANSNDPALSKEADKARSELIKMQDEGS